MYPAKQYNKTRLIIQEYAILYIYGLSIKIKCRYKRGLRRTFSRDKDSRRQKVSLCECSFKIAVSVGSLGRCLKYDSTEQSKKSDDESCEAKMLDSLQPPNRPLLRGIKNQ